MSLHAEALAAYEEGRPAEAAELLRSALRAQLDLEVVNDLAVILHGQGRSGEALDLLRACLAVDPTDTLAAENLAQLTPPPVITLAGHGFAQRLAALTGLAPAEVERRLFLPGPAVEVPVIPLGGTFRMRPGSTDVRQFEDSFLRGYHVPPPEVGDPRLIVDLGANIGTTMAHFATLYPAATVIGIELDAENAELCRGNVARYGERCVVVEGALADRDGTVTYARDPGHEWGYSIVGDGGDVTAEAICLDTLLERHAPGRRVDFLKMDIEGAERDVLRAGGAWVDRVACINLELHPPYGVAEAVADLRALGFATRPARREGCLEAFRA